MHRIRDCGEAEHLPNIQAAFYNFSHGKHKRMMIQEYESNLQRNLQRVLQELTDEAWFPSPYRPKTVMERKRRELARAPIHDHVLEAAAILPYETTLYDYIAWQCPAVRPNMGQHALMRHLRNELYSCSQQEVAYNLSMDIHHYFPLMDHAILKRQILRKVKPGKLQRLLFKVVDSYLQGAPLGIKVSQIFGMLYLADFDRLAMRFFDIGQDPENLLTGPANMSRGASSRLARPTILPTSAVALLISQTSSVLMWQRVCHITRALSTTSSFVMPTRLCSALCALLRLLSFA